ncbi:MAG: extracellular solute-binding protein [Acidaminococcaceae bacterium]|nr:extracellular solute-binding protein [Acidaminococcaceae bacterium]
MKQIYIMLALLTVLAVAGCDTKKQDPPAEGVVRVCSSMNRNLSEALVEAFANKTGIVVEFDPLVATSLSQRLDLLGNSKVDVWMGGSAEEYYMAAERGMLAPYLPRGAAGIPPQYMDRDGRWVPLSIDYIALLSNRNNMRTLGIESPSSWDELLQPVLHNEIVMADPATGGPPYGLITSLWQLRGREAALQFAGNLRTQQVLYLPTEAKAGYEVYLGNKAVAVMSLRHALALEKEHPFLYAAPVRDGNKNMITAAAILKNGEKRKAAERFMEYLFSKEAMQIMREYRMNPLTDAQNDKNKYGDIGIVPNDDLRWMAGEKQALIREWLNAK